MAKKKFTTPVQHEPIRVPKGQKQELRTQFGALCYRFRKEKVQILLVTTRTSGTWIVPKGWPMDGQTPAEVAKIEAWEEAGAIGEISGECLGIFSNYAKSGEPDQLPNIIAVFPMMVHKTKKTFPESDQRERKWLSQNKAAAQVENPELSQMIAAFQPPKAKRDKRLKSARKPINKAS